MSTSNSTVLYHYIPSDGAAIAWAAIFGLSTCLHAFQSVQTKSWYMLPLITGGVCQTVGYICRAIGHYEAPSYSLGPYIIQSLLILIAAVFMAASLYIIMGHTFVGLEAQTYSPIRRKWFTKAFVIGDLVSLFVQGSGAGLLSSEEQDSRDAGRCIVTGGLFIQLLIFGYFIWVLALFHARIRRSPTPRSLSLSFSWHKHWWALLASSVLIMLRSIFRAVEYIEGTEGYLLTHEVFLYVFDAALMGAVFVVLNSVYPSEVTALATGEASIRKVFHVKASVGKIEPENWNLDLCRVVVRTPHIARNLIIYREYIMFVCLGLMWMAKTFESDKHKGIRGQLSVNESTTLTRGLTSCMSDNWPNHDAGKISKVMTDKSRPAHLAEDINRAVDNSCNDALIEDHKR